MALLKGMIWTCTRSKSVSRPNTETNDFQQSVPVLQAPHRNQTSNSSSPEGSKCVSSLNHFYLIPNAYLRNSSKESAEELTFSLSQTPCS
jgi:hypothetical protein